MTSHGYLLATRGVALASDDPVDQTARTIADIVGLARRAEAAGFDAVWVGDSVLAKPRLEALTTLAGVATATDAVDLGTAVYLPNLRHPVHVAHQTATLDQLSGGRLKLGVGVGGGADVEAEHDQLDVPFDARGRLLDEALDVITDLWAGESVTHHGTVHSLDDADIGVVPARTPPIYVASAAFDPVDGFPTSIRNRIATHGDGWLPIGLAPETYAASLDRVRGFIDDAGRDPNNIDAAYYQTVVIADSEDEAIDEARTFLEAYYPELDGLTDEQVRQRGAFGPPETVKAHLDAYEDAGVETFITRFAATNQREQLGRFTALLD